MQPWIPSARLKMLLLSMAADQITIATDEATVKIRANAWFKCPLSAIAARHASAAAGPASDM